MRPIDKTGQRFGRLVVIERVAGRHWRCQCDCGRIAIVSYNLGIGTRSCGCLRRDLLRATKRTHGLSAKPEFYAWYDARSRCHDPQNQSFRRYGGRGIVMCDAWRDSVEQFYRDMGPKPTRRHTLERTDNDGPYAPDNCVWALPKMQANNRGNNRVYSYAGKTMPLSAWSAMLGVNRNTLYARLTRRGWSVSQAFTAPLRRNGYG